MQNVNQVNISYFLLFCLLLIVFYASAFSQSSVQEESTAGNNVNSPDTVAVEYGNNSWKFGGFPVIFYSNETKWAGGGGIQMVKKGYTERHSSSIGLLGFYTQNKQYTLMAGSEMFFKEGTYKLLAGIAYIYYPDKFYGMGNNTSTEDEEDYTTRLFRINPIMQRRLLPNLYIGLQYDYAYADVLEIEQGKILDGGAITGSEGGLASGTGINATWDTRDNNLYPTTGSYHQIGATFYDSVLGSDFIFNAYLLDLRYYKLVFGKHILAFRGVAGINSGNPPFQLLLSTGSLGAFLRGYTASRFMDKHVYTTEAEYRAPLVWRFGLVVFAGFGQVAHDLNQVALQEIKPAAGFGIRFALIPDQKVNLRIDMGIGKDDGSLNINIMEAF